MPTLKLPNAGSADALDFLFTLLPGLITFIVIRQLTSREQKSETTDVVIYSLCYTLIVHGIWQFLNIWSSIPTPDLVGLPLTAVFLGVLISVVTNNGHIYAYLRRLGITREASWSSTWETTFRMTFADKQLSEFIVLHLIDGRRIMGYIRTVSSAQQGGHLAMDHLQWLKTDSDEVSDKRPNRELMLFRGEDIPFIQFLEKGKSHVSRIISTPSDSG